MNWRTWFTRNVTAPQGHEERRPLNLGYALEPRMLFDGAMAATVAEAAQPDAATAEAQPPAKEVVFIDSTVPDHQQLAQGVKPGVEVVVLDAGGDELAQIADWAANHTGYDAVHIISHGAEGQVRLGNLTLTATNLASYATQLSTLGEALNPNGDLLLYGCDIAAGSGANLIASLASITGTDVAASTDDTGGKGDWQLEASTGSIEAGLPLTAQAMAGYGGNLAQVTFDFGSGTTGDTSWGGPFNTAATQTIGADTLKIELDRGGLVLGTENDFFGGGVLFNSLGNVIVGVDRDGAAPTPTKITLTIDPGKVFDLKQFSFVEDSGNPLTLVLTTSKGSTTFPLQGVNNTPGNMAETVNPSNSVLNGVTWVDITLQGGGDMFFFMDNIVLDNITTLSSDHAPTLNATAANPGFTEGGTAVDLFSGVSAATNDAGQVFSGMTLTVTNVLNGSQEWLKIDGVEIALSNGNNGALANGGSYSITLAGSTATVTLSGLSRDNSQMGTLVDGLGYRNTSDNPGNNSRVVTITQINDNGSSSNSANPGLASSVALTPVNDAPSITTAGGTTPFTEGAPAAIDSGLTLSDVDSTTLASATVAITGNFQSGQDLLAFTNNGSTMGNISANYNSGTGVLSLSSAGATATLAQWQAALRAVTYANSSDTPNTSTRTVSFTVNDGTDASSAATKGVSVAAANDAPQVTTTGGTTPFTEGASATAIDSSLTLSDVDSTTLASATVAITGNFQSGQDLLAFTNNGSTMGNISASYNSGTGVLTLSSAGATATLAQWQAALRAVTYANSSESPNTSARTVSFTANDGVTFSSASTKIVSVTAVNDAPQVTTAGGTTPFTEGTPAAIDSSLTLSDVDSTTLASATVAITGNFQSGQDLLAFTNNGSTMGNISANYNSGTGVLTLSSAGATATLAQWQAALRAVTYDNSSGTPNTSTRTVSFTVNDGTDASSAATKNVSVAAANDAPQVATTSGTTPFTEGTSATVIDSGLTLTDTDSATLASATVAITGNFQSGQDLLAFTNDGSTMGNISASYNSGTGVLTLSSAGATATQAQWQAALRAVTYANSSENPNTSARTVSFTANDGVTSSSAATRIVSVSAVNDAPQVTTASGTTPFTEGTPAAIDSSLTLSDVDSTTLASATVTITGNFQSGQDLLAFTNNGSTMGNISANYNSGTGVLTLSSAGATATQAQWQAALRAVTYANSSENPNTSARTVSFTVNDGTDASSASTKIVSVTAVNDAPQVTTAGGTTPFTEGTPAAIDSSLTLSDVDSTTLASATVAITGNFQSGQDLLAFTNDGSTMGNISASYNSGTGVLTLSSAGASATLAQWQAALRAVTYANSSENPNTSTRTISFTVNDGTDASSAATQSVSVTAVNDEPVNNLPTNQTAPQNGQLVFSTANGNGISLSDPDATGSLQVTLTASQGTLTLATIAGLSFTLGDGSGDGSMTFTGSQADINTALNGLIFTPTSGYQGAASLQIVTNDQGSSGSGGAQSDTDTLTITVAPSNTLPVTSGIANQSVSEDAVFNFTLPANTFTDNDPGDSLVLSATLADGSALPGWLSFNPATGTFSGTPGNGDVGNINIRVTATDSSNASVSSTFVLTVVNTNDVPTAGSIANQSVNEDAALSFTLPANTFADVDAGDSLTLSATLADGSALPGWLSFNPATGTFSGTPANGDVGNINIRVTATDSSNTSVSSTFVLTVVNTNDAPTAGSITNQSVNEDAALSFTLPANTFTDNDPGDSLVLSATLADGSALPGWLSFNPATGTFSGTPGNGDVGNINIRVTATDSSNASVSSTFVLTVVNTNDAPTAGSIANQSVTSGTPFSFSLPSGSFSDVDTGDRLTLSATLADGSALPGWLSFNPATGTFSGTPVNGDIGSISIRVNVTDLNNASVSSTFTLTVVQSGQAQGDPEFRVTDGNHKINSSPLSTQPLTTQLSLQPDALLPSESLLTTSADSTSVNFAAGTLSHASALANVFGTNRDGSHGSGQTALNWTGGESNSMSTYWPSSLSEHRQLELFSGGSWSQVLGTGAASPTLTQQLATLQETELSQATALAQALQGR